MSRPLLGLDANFERYQEPYIRIYANTYFRVQNASSEHFVRWVCDGADSVESYKTFANGETDLASPGRGALRVQTRETSSDDRRPSARRFASGGVSAAVFLRSQADVAPRRPEKYHFIFDFG